MLTTKVSKKIHFPYILSDFNQPFSFKNWHNQKSCDHLCLLGLLCGHLLPGYLHGQHVDRHHLPLAMYACNDIWDDLRNDPGEKPEIVNRNNIHLTVSQVPPANSLLSSCQNFKMLTKSQSVDGYQPWLQLTSVYHNIQTWDWDFREWMGLPKNQMKSRYQYWFVIQIFLRCIVFVFLKIWITDN